MPRPGPRPYECVRRAWHSDRHQPIRGSIIQQVFRFVHERHSVKTKKNREWQEKLPIVVLKVEEIIYSKASSEVEYMDLDTLWDRANDAIDTIIRRDQSTETGEPLPPCAEAALTLGCVAIRASRSQRHSNPRSYLCPRTQDPPPGSQSTSGRPETLNSPPRLISESNKPSTSSNHGESNMGSVYPLHYGEVPQFRSQDTIILGRPVFQSLPRLFPLNQPDMGCDLSLRLGLSSGPLNVHPINDCPRAKEFPFFPVESANDQADQAIVRKRKVPLFNNTDESNCNSFSGQRKRPGL